MKEQYSRPETELKEFKIVDVVTTSGVTDDNDEKFNPNN
jgi:hypothetical protein